MTSIFNRRNLLLFAGSAITALTFNNAYAQTIDTPGNQVERRTLSIGNKETISSALLRTGANASDVTIAVRALARLIDIDDVKRDDQLTVFLRQDGGTKRLLGFNLASGSNKSITVVRGVDGNYKARELNTNFQKRTLRVAGVVGTKNILDTVLELGAPERVADRLSEAFQYDVDFEREIGQGSSFELVFERISDTRGVVVREGEPLFAAITLTTGRSIQLYRFLPTGANGPEWFDAAGRSARKFLMKTPINGARLTSNFGYRIHPVLGYSKLHTGVDFGAPIGTPVFAAGDGKIARASIMGGYGNVVDIDHGNGWMTRYAHLSRFLNGLKVGDKVRQGQVVAYSGNTGRSTGPHLHYEVRKNGEPINPMSAQVPVGRTLSGDELARFKALIAQVDSARKQAVTGLNISGTGAALAAN